jgi:hypothetical protein
MGQSSLPDTHAPITASTVDRTGLRFQQALLILLVGSGFVLNTPWLVVLVAAVLALGTIAPSLAVFQRLYRDLLRPAGLLRPDVHAEDPTPHRFAQGLGAIMLIAASGALLAGAALLGWALALIVVVLAAVNLFFGFCAGCFLYFQLQQRRHV